MTKKFQPCSVSINWRMNPGVSMLRMNPGETFSGPLTGCTEVSGVQLAIDTMLVSALDLRPAAVAPPVPGRRRRGPTPSFSAPRCRLVFLGLHMPAGRYY